MTADADVRLVDVATAAAKVAADHADDVDRAARFPAEALDVLRDGGALGALVPTSYGGQGASLTAVADSCRVLSRSCGATAMVFAMHQIQVAVISRHLGDSEWFAGYLRNVATEQRLIASSTSEVGIGGDLGRSSASVTPTGDGRCSFEKQAPTISYAQHADDLFTTLRRDPDAEATDQVVVLSTREQTELTPTGSWDPLGMRGTCSPGFLARATFGPEQVLPVDFATASAESMVPVSHLLWGHVWLGIATEAFERARAFVRAAAARSGSPGSGGRKLSQLAVELGRLQADVAAALRQYEDMIADPDGQALSTMAAALRFNTLKISASELAAAICIDALGVAGFMGYKNDSPFSVGRHIRDTLSASVMVANDRLHESNGALLMVVKDLQ